jgi:HK97 family phage prohead protease
MVYQSNVEIRRFFRQELDLKGREVVGFISYNSVSSKIPKDNGEEFTETIRPWAFTRSLEEKDIPILLQHNQGRILGSRERGNVSIKETEYGITFKLQLEKNALGDEVLRMLRDRQLTGVSPSFCVSGESWQGDSYRIIHQADLIELSLVDLAAYGGSCAALSSRAMKGLAKEEKTKINYQGLYHVPKREVKLL